MDNNVLAGLPSSQVAYDNQFIDKPITGSAFYQSGSCCNWFGSYQGRALSTAIKCVNGYFWVETIMFCGLHKISV